ncbi:MAG: serine hydrolase [Bacteroidales bacterium]|jgi:CubicO group peptidase (beta-lactamase class C family)|nr:serine hydrolase [Bacteroidales bacterium]
MKKILTLSLLFLVFVSAYSQPLTSKEIDKITAETMQAFNVPGIAVAVIKDDRIIHMKGYGVRSIATGEKMDENTLFAIASNSKAFTSAALGILIDEGKLTWETKVIDIIPEFRLYNSYVTEDFNIKDLLTHRSGMGLGAGDLMMWPDSASFTRNEIIHNLRYLKQSSPFRTKYDYDNLLYIVAGVVVERVSGTSWEEFVEERIMRPLGMGHSAASINRLKDRSDIIDAHIPVNGVLQVVPKHESDVHNPAGGIFSSVADMSKWVIMQMNNGKYGDNLDKQIFSERVHSEMWTPQTIIPVREGGPYRSHFAGYGLGWRLTDVSGYLQASHTGGLAGIVTQVTLIPELKLGIIVFTNQQAGAAFTAITNAIKDGYLGIKGTDWVAILRENTLRGEAEAKKITDEVWARVEEQRALIKNEMDHSLYTGTYTDNWFGDIIISDVNGKLRLRSAKSPKLRGDMLYYTGNTFVVRWDDRAMDADAYAVFCLDREGEPVSLTMEAISPLTDFSYDFHDLYLKKVEAIK